MKTKKIIFMMFLAMILLAGCFTYLKEAKWSKDGYLGLHFYNVELGRPGTTLFNYEIIYEKDAIYSFKDIFGAHHEQRNSVIKVVTSAIGCNINQMKTDEFYRSNYTNKNSISDYSIRNISYPTNALPNVVVEIKSGLHMDLNGNEGYVIWSKTLTTDPYNNIQDGTFTGVYKPLISASMSMVLKRIYRNGNFIQLR